MAKKRKNKNYRFPDAKNTIIKTNFKLITEPAFLPNTCYVLGGFIKINIMSGGAFDYNQYKIRQIWEDIQQELDKQGKEKSKEDLRYYDKEYFEKYPEDRFEHVYREDVQQIFKDGIEILKKAEIYAQRIDWYLSGDDGEDSLVSRLKSDLDELS